MALSHSKRAAPDGPLASTSQKKKKRLLVQPGSVSTHACGPWDKLSDEMCLRVMSSLDEKDWRAVSQVNRRFRSLRIERNRRSQVFGQTTILGHTEEVSSLALADNQLVTACVDGTVSVWDMNTQECQYVFRHSNAWTREISLSVKGVKATTASFNPGYSFIMKCWNIEAGTCMGNVEVEGRASAVYVDKHVFGGTNDGQIFVWDINGNDATLLNTFRVAPEQKSTQNPLNTINVSQCAIDVISSLDNLVASAERGGKVEVWNWKERSVVAQISTETSVTELFFIDSSHLAIGTIEGCHIWNLDTGEAVWSLGWDTKVDAGAKWNVRCFVQHHNSLYMSCSDNKLRVWSMTSHQLHEVIQHGNGPAFHVDNNFIITTDSGTVYIADFARPGMRCPEASRQYLKLAEKYLGVGDPNMAVEYLERANSAQLGPSADAQLAFARYYEDVEKDIDKAKHYYCMAIADEATATGRGWWDYAMFLATTDKPKSLVLLRKALELSPDDPLLLWEYAILLGNAGETPNAKLMLDRARYVDNNFSKGLLKFGIYLRDIRRKYDKAEAAFNEVKADPQYTVSALCELAHLAITRENKGLAKQLFEEALTMDPMHVPALYRYAALLGRGLHNFEGAEKFFKRAIEIGSTNPEDGKLFRMYGEFLQDSKQSPYCVLEMYHEAMVRDPSDSTTVALYAMQYVKCRENKYFLLNRHFERALRFDPYNPSILLIAAKICLNDNTEPNRVALTLPLVKKAMQIRVSQQQAMLFFAMILSQDLKLFEKADELYCKVIKEFPESPLPYRRYAEFLERRGQRDEATKYYEQARQLATAPIVVG
eukprot:GFYU01000656.1.p1 GENE.GFYU01000656.1~~GFYU01000656.1.p1  ORF type:complete len:824 (+),score=247.61 GFYU01000656.1:175-2646(+)